MNIATVETDNNKRSLEIHNYEPKFELHKLEPELNLNRYELISSHLQHLSPVQENPETLEGILHHPLLQEQGRARRHL